MSLSSATRKALQWKQMQSQIPSRPPSPVQEQQICVNDEYTIMLSNFCDLVMKLNTVSDGGTRPASDVHRVLAEKYSLNELTKLNVAHLHILGEFSILIDDVVHCKLAMRKRYYKAQVKKDLLVIKETLDLLKHM